MAEDKTSLFRMPGGLIGELKCHRGSRQGESFSLSAGTFVIGRDESSDLCLADEPGVSKEHAKIIAENENYILMDNESRNGTILNGKPITKAVLVHGDKIRICGCDLTFYSLGSTGVSEAAIVTASGMRVDAEPSPPTLAPWQNSALDRQGDSVDDDPDLYSDDLDFVDEEADTMQPITKDRSLDVGSPSEGTMTVTAAMVDEKETSDVFQGITDAQTDGVKSGKAFSEL